MMMGFALMLLLIMAGNTPAQQNVIWTNVVGVSASGNNLTKTAADSWGNAGAVSTQTINSGDGYVEFTASETTTYRLLGLSHTDTNQMYNTIDFAIYLQPGILSGYVGSTYLGNLGSYAMGDVLRVQIEGGVVKYKKNGTVFYTATATAMTICRSVKSWARLACALQHRATAMVIMRGRNTQAWKATTRPECRILCGGNTTIYRGDGLRLILTAGVCLLLGRRPSIATLMSTMIL
jgi:hypothetical protein